MGHVAVTASMMAEKLPSGRTLLRKDQRVQFITFSTQWGPMHPQEAIERYERELARRPADPALWVGLGNVQRFLGHLDEAEAHYQRALNGNPRYADAWISLAQVAGERRDIPEAMRCWQRVKELAPDAPHPQAERLALMEEATGNLAELRRGRIPEYVPNVSLTGSGVPAPAAAPAGQRTSAPPKIGRNDPCPCGSGKKYKHCHGRAQ
jgi:tetratricopeptide (TPR) repeat protein